MKRSLQISLNGEPAPEAPVVERTADQTAPPPRPPATPSTRLSGRKAGVVRNRRAGVKIAAPKKRVDSKTATTGTPNSRLAVVRQWAVPCSWLLVIVAGTCVALKVYGGVHPDDVDIDVTCRTLRLPVNLPPITDLAGLRAADFPATAPTVNGVESYTIASLEHPDRIASGSPGPAGMTVHYTAAPDAAMNAEPDTRITFSTEPVTPSSELTLIAGDSLTASEGSIGPDMSVIAEPLQVGDELFHTIATNISLDVSMLEPVEIPFHAAATHATYRAQVGAVDTSIDWLNPATPVELELAFTQGASSIPLYRAVDPDHGIGMAAPLILVDSLRGRIETGDGNSSSVDTAFSGLRIVPGKNFQLTDFSIVPGPDKTGPVLHVSGHGTVTDLRIGDRELLGTEFDYLLEQPIDKKGPIGLVLAGLALLAGFLGRRALAIVADLAMPEK